jgi:Leucine-rich repeat (LRR) protein
MTFNLLCLFVGRFYLAAFKRYVSMITKPICVNMKKINFLTITRLKNILIILVLGCVWACKNRIPADSVSMQEREPSLQHINLTSLNANSSDSLWEQFFAQRGMQRVGGHLFLNECESTPLFKGKFNSILITDAEAKEAMMGFIKYLHYRNITMRSINIVKGVLCDLGQAIIEFASITEQFAHLESLTLYNNRIQDMPALIAAVPNLKELCLDNNNLRQLPEELGALTQLEKLHVSNNQLYELPSSINQLTNLTELDLSSNQFSCFPLLMHTARKINIQTDEIDNVTPIKNPFVKMRALFLKNNQLRKIPDCIGAFTNLERLYLDNNKIYKLPRTMAQLTKLSRLVLVYNELKELPACMHSFITLGRLNARHNAWHRPQELTTVAYGELRREAQKMLPASLFALSMHYIVEAAGSSDSQVNIELEHLLPIGLSYQYLPYVYQELLYWKEGKKYCCFLPLGDINIPLSMDFSFATLADLDDLLKKVLKGNNKEGFIFQKKK